MDLRAGLRKKFGSTLIITSIVDPNVTQYFLACEDYRSFLDFFIGNSWREGKKL